ncbi:MAG: MATE family efflux transporter [Rhodobacterales bacterium]|nr:MAG: MATE family efflux transporter [Rhodobacterales bacterium]
MAAPARAVTHRRILAIAGPIVLANVTVPLLGLVDTGVVGQMGRAEPIGAVGVGAVILSAFYWLFGFLRMGMTGLAAQASGEGDSAENAALLARGLLIGLVAGLALIALQGPLLWGGFQVSPASEEVETLARHYVGIRIWSAPAAIMLYAVTGWLIAQERTRAVLVLQLWMNGLNIGLDLLFVMQLDWGVAGVARASFLAEWTGLALGLYMCRGALMGPKGRIFEPERLRRMAVVNTDIMIRSVLLQAIFISFLLLGARFGDVPLAANQVLLQFLEVTAFALDGFAFSAEALVGQAMGARDRAGLRRAAGMASLWGAGACVVLALGFALLGPWGIDRMTTAQPVRDLARVYLPFMVAAPILGAASWMLDGIFIGATRTRDMRNMMLVAALIYLIAVLALMPVFGNAGLWMALLISFVARGITLGLRYPALEARAAR